MLNSKLKGILLIFFTTIITGFGQIFFKLASRTIDFTINGLILNYNLWIGFVLFSFALITFIFGIRTNDLTSLFPIMALSYIWIIIIANIIFKEQITLTEIIGTVIIIIGAIMLGMNANKIGSKKWKKSSLH